MMVGTEFSGDDNDTLMDVQFSAYGNLVSHLCAASRERYIAAADLIQIDNDLSTKLRSMDFFDHRTLQSTHDQIAAYFRFRSPGLSQLLLGESEEDYRQRLNSAWREFFPLEVAELNTQDDFTRAVCTATAYGNKELGVEAEKWLDQHLRDRYAARGLVFRSLSDTLKLASID